MTTQLPPPIPGIEPHTLGKTTIHSVDRMTSMTADEIEKVAEQVLEGAHEVADILRHAAHRMRECGLFANERLANFVRVATTCAEAARMMQESVEMRDDPTAAPPPKVVLEKPASNGDHKANLDELADKIDRSQ